MNDFQFSVSVIFFTLLLLLLNHWFVTPYLGAYQQRQQAVFSSSISLDSKSLNLNSASTKSAKINTMTTRYAPPLVLRASTKTTGTIVWLHGLGDSGHGWKFFGEELQKRLPYLSFVFPHASERQITLNGGYPMPAWHDFRSLDKLVPSTFAGSQESREYISTLLDKEIEQGTPANRIILGGFSQGAGMSVITGYQYPHKLAGVVAFSGFLAHINSETDTFKNAITEANKETPLFIAHGTADPVVRFEAGEHLAAEAKNAGIPLEFHPYKGMAHSTCVEEVADVITFIKKVLPPP